MCHSIIIVIVVPSFVIMQFCIKKINSTFGMTDCVLGTKVSVFPGIMDIPYKEPSLTVNIRSFPAQISTQVSLIDSDRLNVQYSKYDCSNKS